MQKIDGTTILINRGDILNLSLSIKDGTSDYTFQVGDKIVFSVYEKYLYNKKPVLTKLIEVEEQCTSIEINLTSNETKIGTYLNDPVDYWYEIELNGQYTIVGYDENGAKIFRLFPEGYQQ